jgi:hypothetical protein
MPRNEFVQAYRCLFLLSLHPPHRPHRAAPDAGFTDDNPTFDLPELGAPSSLFGDHVTDRTHVDEEDPPILLLPVRKTAALDADKITVGRMASNDIVIPDRGLSRTHAWFKIAGAKITLSDGNSTNGTYVDGVKLAEDGSPTLVTMGVRIKFGYLDFDLLDSVSAWQRAHAL